MHGFIIHLQRVYNHVSRMVESRNGITFLLAEFGVPGCDAGGHGGSSHFLRSFLHTQLQQMGG